MKQLVKKSIGIFLILLMLTTVLVSCLQTDDNRPAVTLENHSLSADMVRHAIMQMSREDLMEVDSAVIMERVKQTLSDYLMVYLAAQEFGFSLSSADRRDIRGRIREMQDELENRDTFLQGLYALGLSEQVVFDLMYMEELREELYPIVFAGVLNLSTEDIINDIVTNFIFTNHILISARSRTATELAEEADRLYALATSGEDMSALAIRYSDDQMSTGHFFAYDSTDLPIYYAHASQGLAVGEISRIETSRGIYIIRRNEITVDIAESQFSNLYLQSNNRMFREALREIASKNNTEVVFTDVFYEAFEKVLATLAE